MKLQFHHHGKQFFFVTLSLEGRPSALSRLVEGQARPDLLPPGEVVKAGFAAMHKVFPAATLSNFVIMPDHVHYLLIADYEVSRGFNPLWTSHLLMDAIEEGWCRMAGGLAPEPPDMAPMLAQAYERGREEAARMEAAMALAEAAEASEAERLALAARLRGEFRARRGFGGPGGTPPSLLRFDRRCYIELSFGAAQLKAIRHYIRCNPARALWKLQHPDRFVRFADIRHPILDASRPWDAMGNLTLLGSPFLYHVRLTLQKSVAEHEAAIGEIMEKAERGLIPVSGFISPGEKELLRRLKANPRTRFIKMLPYALPPRYDPTVEDSRELAADRMLILSGFPQTILQTRNDPAFRANCLRLNDLAAALCAAARRRG